MEEKVLLALRFEVGTVEINIVKNFSWRYVNCSSAYNASRSAWV